MRSRRWLGSTLKMVGKTLEYTFSWIRMATAFLLKVIRYRQNFANIGSESWDCKTNSAIDFETIGKATDLWHHCACSLNSSYVHIQELCANSNQANRGQNCCRRCYSAVNLQTLASVKLPSESFLQHRESSRSSTRNLWSRLSQEASRTATLRYVDNNSRVLHNTLNISCNAELEIDIESELGYC